MSRSCWSVSAPAYRMLHEGIAVPGRPAVEARHLPSDSGDFDFGQNTLSPATWGELDYAGLRVHHHLNGTEYKDELIVFLGASYFRALAAGTRYGLSARGLAVDTVGGQGEEFPYFVDDKDSARPPRPLGRGLSEMLAIDLSQVFSDNLPPPSGSLH